MLITNHYRHLRLLNQIRNKRPMRHSFVMMLWYALYISQALMPLLLSNQKEIQWLLCCVDRCSTSSSAFPSQNEHIPAHISADTSRSVRRFQTRIGDTGSKNYHCGDYFKSV